LKRVSFSFSQNYEKDFFMIELCAEEVQAVSGADVYYDIGHSLGEFYWAARDYMSEVVYPYYLW